MRRSIRGRAACTCPRFRPRNAGTTGSSSTPRRGREREEQHYMLVPTTCFNCESACGLLAYVDRDDAAGPEVRGQPRAPRFAGPQLRQGPGDPQPGHRPRPDPLPAAPGRRARRGPVGAGELGRRARRHRGPDPGGHHRGTAQRDHVARRPARRGRLHRAGAGQLGRRRPQLAHQRLLSSGGRTGYQFWMGTDRPSPDHANAKVIFLISSHLETGHYFNPHAQRIIEAQGERREDRRARHPAVQHRHARRLLAGAVARQRGGDQPGRSRNISSAPAATTASSSGGGGTGRSTCRPAARRLPATSRASRRRWRRSTPSSPSSSPRPSPASTPPRWTRSPRLWRGAGTRFSSHNWRSAAASGTSAAGRSRARCS